MKIFKRVILIITLIIMVLSVVSAGSLWAVNGDVFFIGYNKFFIAPSCNKADSFLKNNIGELTCVVNELSEMNYDIILIRKDHIRGESGYKMEVKRNGSNYETIPIPDELINHIGSLCKTGIQDISCDRNFVDFTMWSTMDESRGIIYSLFGTKPDDEQLIEASQLSKDNWYYYVHNYEKAKEKNPERFK